MKIQHFCIDISIKIGVAVKVSTDNHSRSTLFSPQKNWTGVIKIIILVWPEGRILGRVWERGVDDPPVYKPTCECSVHHTTTRPPQDNMKAFLVGILCAVKVLWPVPRAPPVTGQQSCFLVDCYLSNAWFYCRVRPFAVFMFFFIENFLVISCFYCDDFSGTIQLNLYVRHIIHWT